MIIIKMMIKNSHINNNNIFHNNYSHYSDECKNKNGDHYNNHDHHL